MCGHVHYGIYIATNTKLWRIFSAWEASFSFTRYICRILLFRGVLPSETKKFPTLHWKYFSAGLSRVKLIFVLFLVIKNLHLNMEVFLLLFSVDKHPIFLDFSFERWQNLPFYVETWLHNSAVWLSSVSTRSILSSSRAYGTLVMDLLALPRKIVSYSMTCLHTTTFLFSAKNVIEEDQLRLENHLYWTELGIEIYCLDCSL